MDGLLLSPKYKAFMRCNARVEFLEGTTYAGKTTVGVVKFLLRVAASSKQQHIISGLDLGTIEKNIINKELGALDVFGSLLSYHPSGHGGSTLPHLLLHTQSGDKTVYVLGYDNKARWKKALGGQYGCLYIDEINIADMEYVREAAMRCDYLLATLNPDNPALPVYSEYINHARPLPEYADDAPLELLGMLNQTPIPGWVWWYFSFEHNASLSDAKRQQIITNVPPGTKIYKNKILGLRGKSTGLVFANFEHSRHIIAAEQAKQYIQNPTDNQQVEYFTQFSSGLDTSYSTKSTDTIAMSFVGITNLGKAVVLAERVYNNAQLRVPLAPSDTAINFVDFLDRCSKQWGAVRAVFVDNADAATLTELRKYKAAHGCLYDFTGAWKKTKIIDRINLQLGWFAHDEFLVVDTCHEYIQELDVYSWREDKDAEPEDANDHMINSVQYAWLPYKHQIGGKHETGG